MNAECLERTGTALLRIYFDQAEDCAARHQCRMCALEAVQYRAELERRGVVLHFRRTTIDAWQSTTENG